MNTSDQSNCMLLIMSHAKQPTWQKAFHTCTQTHPEPTISKTACGEELHISINMMMVWSSSFRSQQKTSLFNFAAGRPPSCQSIERNAHCALLELTSYHTHVTSDVGLAPAAGQSALWNFSSAFSSLVPPWNKSWRSCEALSAPEPSSESQRAPLSLSILDVPSYFVFISFC